MEKVKAFHTLPKTYFFDTKTRHIILAYYATEDTTTDIADIPAGTYAFMDFDKIVRIMPPKEFESRFKKVGDIFGLFHARDVENTTLNLKVLKEEFVEIKRPEERIIEITLRNKSIKLVYRDAETCYEDLKHIKFLLAKANKTL